MATMKDIAGKAGVSRPTVSAILNKREASVGISKATRIKVLEAAESLGYRRNELARAVVTGKNRMLGFVAAKTVAEHVTRTMMGALEEVEHHGYTLKLLRMHDMESGVNLIDKSVELRLGGLILIHPGDLEWLEYVREQTTRHRIPVAIVDSSVRYPWALHVMTDDAQGGNLATKHLIDLGHRRIAYIGGNITSPVSLYRCAGYRKALESAGIPVDEENISYYGWKAERAEEIFQELVDRPAERRPTAFFCDGDSTALVLIRRARQLALRVPEDISIVGYGNFERTDLTDPPLTTIAQPFEEVGKRAVRLMLEHMDKVNDGEAHDLPELFLPTTLVERKSTGAAHLAGY